MGDKSPEKMRCLKIHEHFNIIENGTTESEKKKCCAIYLIEVQGDGINIILSENLKVPIVSVINVKKVKY